jgi:hypothetical protein
MGKQIDPKVPIYFKEIHCSGQNNSFLRGIFVFVSVTTFRNEQIWSRYSKVTKATILFTVSNQYDFCVSVTAVM